MGFEIPVGPFITVPASTGLKQYTFVDLSTSASALGGVVLTKPSALGKCIGVLVSSGTTSGTVANRPQSVQCYGIAKVLGGSNAIKAGSVIFAATADGRAELGTTNSTKYVVGRAFGKSTSTSAQVVPVLLLHSGTII